jgi:5-aminopentanamidase
MRVAISSPPYPRSLEEGIRLTNKYVREASTAGADIICFPESFLPGYPLEEETRETCSPLQLQDALGEVCSIAAANSVAVIMPMDWYIDGAMYNVAQVISKTGEVLGFQTKNQLDPSEDTVWKAGTGRQLFEVEGVKFGISICHEGFRYPETVRWAARRGASIVFHPNLTGSNVKGVPISEWGHKDSPYYEKGQMMRALENTIYFAPSNYAFRFPESASSVISPDGKCIVHQKYGEPGVIVADIDLTLATGLLAQRFRPQLYSSLQ